MRTYVLYLFCIRFMGFFLFLFLSPFIFLFTVSALGSEVGECYSLYEKPKYFTYFFFGFSAAIWLDTKNWACHHCSFGKYLPKYRCCCRRIVFLASVNRHTDDNKDKHSVISYNGRQTKEITIKCTEMPTKNKVLWFVPPFSHLIFFF